VLPSFGTTLRSYCLHYPYFINFNVCYTQILDFLFFTCSELGCTKTIQCTPTLTFEAEAHVNIILEISLYLKENTALHHYKDQLVNAVYDTPHYSENHTKPVDTKCAVTVH
jgi:hypothetical protein